MADAKNSCVIVTFIIGHVHTRQEQLKTSCSPPGWLGVWGTELCLAPQGQNSHPTDRIWPRASCPSSGRSTQLVAPRSRHSNFQQRADKAACPEVPAGQTERAQGFGRSDRTRRGRHTAGRAPPCSAEKFTKQAPGLLAQTRTFVPVLASASTRERGCGIKQLCIFYTIPLEGSGAPRRTTSGERPARPGGGPGEPARPRLGPGPGKTRGPPAAPHPLGAASLLSRAGPSPRSRPAGRWPRCWRAAQAPTWRPRSPPGPGGPRRSPASGAAAAGGGAAAAGRRAATTCRRRPAGDGERGGGGGGGGGGGIF